MNKKDWLKSPYQITGFLPKRTAKPCENSGHPVPTSLFPSSNSDNLILSPQRGRKTKLYIELKLPAGISLALIIL